MSIELHVARRDNPHVVTKEQVDLDQIQNYPLANQDEVLGLNRSDRYIDMASVAWIQQAFNQYMYDIGLTDENGNLRYSPFDISGEYLFTGEDNGSFTLSGSHPTAAYVDVVLKDGNNVVFKQNNIALAATLWTANTTGVTLDPSKEYELFLYYRDASLAHTGHFNETVGFNLSDEIMILRGSNAILAINTTDNTGNLFGYALGAYRVDVRVLRDTQVFAQQSNITIDQTTGRWDADISDIFLYSPYNYRLETKLYYIDGTYIGERIFENILVSTGDLINFVIQEDGSGSAYGFVNGYGDVRLRIVSDGSEIFNSIIAKNGDIGYWEQSFSMDTLDSSVVNEAHIDVYDLLGRYVFTESFIIYPDSMDLGGFYDEQRDAWYLDFKELSEVGGLDPDRVDFGKVID